MGYWQEQAYAVMLVIRTSDGEIRWVDVSAYLNQESRGGKTVKQVVFEGERFDSVSVQEWRKRSLGGAERPGNALQAPAMSNAGSRLPGPKAAAGCRSPRASPKLRGDFSAGKNLPAHGVFSLHEFPSPFLPFSCSRRCVRFCASCVCCAEEGAGGHGDDGVSAFVD